MSGIEPFPCSLGAHGLAWPSLLTLYRLLKPLFWSLSICLFLRRASWARSLSALPQSCALWCSISSNVFDRAPLARRCKKMARRISGWSWENLHLSPDRQGTCFVMLCKSSARDRYCHDILPQSYSCPIGSLCRYERTYSCGFYIHLLRAHLDTFSEVCRFQPHWS